MKAARPAMTKAPKPASTFLAAPVYCAGPDVVAVPATVDDFTVLTLAVVAGVDSDGAGVVIDSFSEVVSGAAGAPAG
jgi:hypothetical protein